MNHGKSQWSPICVSLRSPRLNSLFSSSMSWARWYLYSGEPVVRINQCDSQTCAFVFDTAPYSLTTRRRAKYITICYVMCIEPRLKSMHILIDMTFTLCEIRCPAVLLSIDVPNMRMVDQMNEVGMRYEWDMNEIGIGYMGWLATTVDGLYISPP